MPDVSRPYARPSLTAVAALALPLALAACSSPAAPEPEVALPTAGPVAASGATLDADPGSAQTRPVAGERFAVVLADYEDPEAQRAVVDELTEQAVGAQVDVATAHTPAEGEQLLNDAVDSHPFAVVIIGPALVGTADLLTAQSLDQRFVIFGGQMAEPTANVQAVVWPGADGRAALAAEERTMSNTQQYAAAAVRVGLSEPVLESENGLVHYLR